MKIDLGIYALDTSLLDTSVIFNLSTRILLKILLHSTFSLAIPVRCFLISVIAESDRSTRCECSLLVVMYQVLLASRRLSN